MPHRGARLGTWWAKPGFLVFLVFLVFWFNHGFIRISPQTLIKPNLGNARETAETAGNGRNDRRLERSKYFELEPRAQGAPRGCKISQRGSIESTSCVSIGFVSIGRVSINCVSIGAKTYEKRQKRPKLSRSRVER